MLRPNRESNVGSAAFLLKIEAIAFSVLLLVAVVTGIYGMI